MNTMQIIKLLSLTSSFMVNISKQLSDISLLISKVQLEKRSLSDKEINDLDDNLNKAINRLEKAIND